MRRTSIIGARFGVAALARALAAAALAIEARAARADEIPVAPSWLLGAQVTAVAQAHPDASGPTFSRDLSFGPGAAAGWSLTASVSCLPTLANGGDLDWDVRHHRSEMAEGELRWQALGGSGSMKLLLFVGSYRDALAAAAPGTPPKPLIAYRQVGAVKVGAGLTADLRGLKNPGMNPDHGPTLVAGLRLHAHLQGG